jgi:hypothetical protein
LQRDWQPIVVPEVATIPRARRLERWLFVFLFRGAAALSEDYFQDFAFAAFGPVVGLEGLEMRILKIEL